MIQYLGCSKRFKLFKNREYGALGTTLCPLLSVVMRFMAVKLCCRLFVSLNKFYYENRFTSEARTTLKKRLKRRQEYIASFMALKQIISGFSEQWISIPLSVCGTGSCCSAVDRMKYHIKQNQVRTAVWNARLQITSLYEEGTAI